MISLADAQPGDLMFTTIGGGAGVVVGAGQVLLAAAEPGMIWRQGVARWWRKRHVGVVAPGGRLVQAMPGGAEEVDLDPSKHWTSHTVFLRPAYDPTPRSDMGHPHGSQGYRVSQWARGYEGTRYDFATYAAIPAWRRGLRTKRIKRVISGTDAMMCSRLADAALRDAGWHVFDDGRLPGDVTPSELYRAVLASPGVTVFGAGILA